MNRNAIRRTVLWLAAAPALALGAPAFAQDKAADQPGKGPGEVTIDVVERPLRDVIAYIMEKTDVNIVLSREAEDIPVTAKLRNLPWREALAVIVERAGAQLDERSANLIKIEKPPRVTFEFDNASARTVIKAIADTANANIVVGREVEGTVTLTLTDIPWRVALDTIVKTLGYAVVQEERGILRIVDPANLALQLETRTFRLRYVRPQPNYRAKIDTDVSVNSIQAPDDTAEGVEKNFKLLSAFKQALAPEGSVTYVRDTNTLVATGTTPKLEQLEKLIARVDVEPAQVYVDLKFIATTNTDFLDVGINPGEKGPGFNMSFGKMIHDVPFQLGAGGWEDHLSAFRGGPEKYGPLPLTDSAAAFTFGTLDFSQTQFALNLIRTDKNSKIVQAPKLIALDNQEATIFVGDTIRFAETKAASNQSGGLEYSIEEAEGSPVQTGFQLLMIPHVIPDKDQIMMTIIPQQRALSGPDDGFRRFVTSSGTLTGVQELLLPQERSATVVTHLKLDNGHTAVLGGLLQDNESKTVNKVPLLGDIPVLGYLFKGETTSNTKANLVVFLTPKILRDQSQMREIVARERVATKDRLEAELLEMFGDTSVAPAKDKDAAKAKDTAKEPAKAPAADPAKDPAKAPAGKPGLAPPK
jgi:type IV pilus assembly protein PilQ